MARNLHYSLAISGKKNDHCDQVPMS
uniref:Uncharacterized protein n=1 Tax=Arundo donax TaxID=35708 RepID=A0A0A9B7N6_ARUDO